MVVLTTILILLAITLLYAFVWRDGEVWTPIPASMAAWFVGVFRGSWSLTLWRLALTVVFVGSALALILSFGMIGSFIAALILTTLLAETVRAWIMDLWNANFHRIGVR